MCMSGKEKLSRGNCRRKDRDVFGLFKKWQGKGCSGSTENKREGWKVGQEVASG